MAFLAFVNFGDIKGDCTEKDHKDWTMAESYHHGVTQRASVTQMTAGGPTSQGVSHSEYSIVKMLDSASPKLFEAACKGTVLKDVTIELVRAGDTPVKYMVTKLKNVLVSGVHHNGDPKGDAQFPTETINLTYSGIEITYTKQGLDGKASGNVAAKWDVAQGAAA
jgi:type VI secretion system secreted protein Hcp